MMIELRIPQLFTPTSRISYYHLDGRDNTTVVELSPTYLRTLHHNNWIPRNLRPVILLSSVIKEVLLYNPSNYMHPQRDFYMYNSLCNTFLNDVGHNHIVFNYYSNSVALHKYVSNWD